MAGLFARLNKLSSKPPMVVYLGFLLLLGLWQPQFRTFWADLANISQNLPLLFRGIVILVIYSVLDAAIGYWKTKKFILPSSSWISGLILSLVLAPTAGWSMAIAAPVLASLGKHIIRYRKRHVFNPAGLALIILGLATIAQGTVSWWGASWGPIATIIIALSGLFTIYRVKRISTWVAFTVVYLVGSGLLLLTRGGDVAGLWSLINDGTFWFFSTVMLVEPVTTAYTPAKLRMWFGGAVGLLVVLLGAANIPTPDPFLISLLLGNLGATVVTNLRRL